MPRCPCEKCRARRVREAKKFFNGGSLPYNTASYKKGPAEKTLETAGKAAGILGGGGPWISGPLGLAGRALGSIVDVVVNEIKK